MHLDQLDHNLQTQHVREFFWEVPQQSTTQTIFTLWDILSICICIYNLAWELANGTFISSASKQPKNTTPAHDFSSPEKNQRQPTKNLPSNLLRVLQGFCKISGLVFNSSNWMGQGFLPWKSKLIICLKGFSVKTPLVFSKGLFHQEFQVGLFG